MRAIIAFVFVVFPFFTIAHAAEVSIVGNWYEETVYNDKRVISVIDFKPDSTFSLAFRVCTANGSHDGTDTGHWRYSNGILHVTIETVDGGPTLDVNDYRTESNDGHVWRYVSISGTGFDQDGPVHFRDVLVTPGSKLPGCKLTS